MTLPWKTQSEILRAILTSTEVCRELAGVLRAEHFLKPGHGRVAEIAMRLGADQGSPATEGQIQAELSRDSEVLHAAALGSLAEAMGGQAPPVAWAIEAGRGMAAVSELALLAGAAQGYAEQGAFDDFAEDARKVAALAMGGGNSSTGIGDIVGRHSPDRVLGISTGVTSLDAALRGGGWQPGQLVLILGPDGGGKSHAAVSFGAEALRNGLRVHATTLEMDAKELRGRYDRSITGISSEDFWGRLPEVKEELDEIEKRLTILEAVDRPLGVAGLESEILRLGPEKKPDLIIVDAGYLLSTGRDYAGDGAAQAQRNDLSSLHQRLRIMGQRLRAPVLTPFQANREGLKKMYGSRQGAGTDVLMRMDMADALSVSRHADIVISVNQGIAEYGTEEGRLWLDKDRGGRQFKVIECRFRWSMSRITERGY